MKAKDYLFGALLFVPAMLVVLMNVGATQSLTQTVTRPENMLLVLNDMLGITVLPLIGGLLYKNKTAYFLALWIPATTLIAKVLVMDAGEDIITFGVFAFLIISLVSCSLGCGAKMFYGNCIRGRPLFGASYCTNTKLTTKAVTHKKA